MQGCMHDSYMNHVRNVQKSACFLLVELCKFLVGSFKIHVRFCLGLGHVDFSKILDRSYKILDWTLVRFLTDLVRFN